MRRRQAIGAVVAALLVLVVAGCGDQPPASAPAPAPAPEPAEPAEPDPVEAPTEPAPTTSAAPPTTAAPTRPFAVGRSALTVTDEARDGRTIPVDLWYPSPVEVAGAAPPAPYAGTVSAAARAEPPIAEGTHPLVIWSHGSGATPSQTFWFAELLAANGFVVAGPAHPGDSVGDDPPEGGPAFVALAHERQRDVTAVIDAVLDRATSSNDPLSGAVDPDRIGVAGHSFGAATALGVVAGAGGVPADDRVDAVVSIAPYTDLFSDDELGAVDVPTMLVAGTRDWTTPPEPQATRPFELVGTDDVVRVEVADAAHTSFTDACALAEAGLEAVPEGEQRAAAEREVRSVCPDDAAAPADVHRLTGRYAASFLLAHVAGEEPYRATVELAVDGVELFVR